MIHDPTPAAEARALITETCLLNGQGPPASVLICDDRPAVLHNLSQMLRPLPFLLDISWEPDGFTLLDTPVDLVLIGIHRANTTGTEATNLLLPTLPNGKSSATGDRVLLTDTPATRLLPQQRRTVAAGARNSPPWIGRC